MDYTAVITEVQSILERVTRLYGRDAAADIAQEARRLQLAGRGSFLECLQYEQSRLFIGTLFYECDDSTAH
jgi:hypothetical protein